MGKYEIGVKESYYSVFEIEGNSYQDAIKKIKTKIENDEIVLEDITSYRRSYVNDNSKFLEEKITLNLSYNPENNSILISDGKNKANYTCYDVPDIIRSFSYFCNTFIEDHEITLEQLYGNETEVINEK